MPVPMRSAGARVCGAAVLERGLDGDEVTCPDSEGAVAGSLSGCVV
jgi:hypothetical protein